MLFTWMSPSNMREFKFTACYLIDPMVFYYFDDASTTSILFPQKSVFSLPSHIFSYLSLYINIIQPLINAKALKCILLIYLCTQKEYRLYSPLSSIFLSCWCSLGVSLFIQSHSNFRTWWVRRLFSKYVVAHVLSETTSTIDS